MNKLPTSLLTLYLLFTFSTATAQPAILTEHSLFSPVEARHGMVVAAEALAAQAGLKVLQQGGNAVDAAVTVGFVMAVTYPRAGNLGGGGFMLVYSADSGSVNAVDYRETAPAGAHQDMYLDAAGKVDSRRSRFSHLAAGVPGTVAGLALALEKYGTLSLAQTLAPAIRLAEEGFTLSAALSRAIQQRAEVFRQWPATAAVFLKPDGGFYQAGEVLVQKDLAATLRRIAEHGPAGFYQGETAALIAKDMAAHHGLITEKDLAGYRARIRAPVRGTYRGYEIVSMPPPGSGGVHIVQLLNILENHDALGHNGAAGIHLMAEAMKFAYADRSKYLGDTDFTPVPVAGLTAKAYAKQIHAKIDPAKATPSRAIAPGQPPGYESHETTHYAIADRFGNVVSNTYTLNFSFGSGILVPGTGVLLNNEMDDFSAKPGVPNAYGLLGGAANAIEPGKRMLSSMSPTLVLKDGKPVLALGSPGGARIITTVLQVILNVIDHGMNIQEAVNAPRIHHQWLPDELRVEKGLSPDTLALLTQRGHQVVVKRPMGAVAAIALDGGMLYGAADPRRVDGVAVGY